MPEEIKKTSLRKEPLLLGLILITGSLAAIIAGGWHGYKKYMNAPEPALDREVRVEIEQGAGFKKITAALHEKGVISRPRWFNLAGFLEDATTRVQAGVYTFRPGMSPLQVLDMIMRGEITKVTLIVPEGSNVFEIGRALSELGPWSADEFVRLARSARKADELGVPADSLEGYLFPAGYQLTMSMTEEDVIDLMTGRAVKEKTEQRTATAQKAGLTWHQVLTLASMVEKETSVAEEMPLIADVFLNRMEKGMLLQSDPTAVYGIKSLSEGVTGEDLKNENPYNTYLHKGLPPGPICNPGEKAIEAALHPADTDYLYFVATGEGGHLFAKTYEEHRRNINSYRRTIRRLEREAGQGG